MTGDRSLLGASLIVLAAIGVWGVLDPSGMVDVATVLVDQYFRSRGWFVMLSVSGMLVFCLAVAFSRYGDIRLGADEDRPEFSTPSWIAMLFAAGMGVGLLFWAVAEPLTHFAFASKFMHSGLVFNRWPTEQNKKKRRQKGEKCGNTRPRGARQA